MKTLTVAQKAEILNELTRHFRAQLARELAEGDIREGDAVDCHFHRTIYIGDDLGDQVLRFICAKSETTH